MSAATTTRERILLVDDATETLELVGRILAGARYETVAVTSAAGALAALRTSHFDLVVTDLKMPGASGLELVREVRERYPDTEIMMITGYATVEGAVEAVKTGAQEYLAKPFRQEELLGAVGRALARRRAHRPGAEPAGRFGLVGRSAGMQHAFAQIERAVGRQGPLLLVGESGTGRAATARAVARARGIEPAGFCIVEADTVSAAMAPGATEALCVRGIEWADAAALETLLELLRAPGHVFVCAGPWLQRLAAAGLVRGDLLARLEPSAVALPPLRERGDDIVLLAEVFAARIAARASLPPPALEPAVQRALREYGWPGNVAELHEVVLGACLAARGGTLGVEHLAPRVAGSISGPRIERPLAEVEAEHIRAVLARVEGRKGRAAEILGIDRKTLREKLRVLGEDGPGEAD